MAGAAEVLDMIDGALSDAEVGGDAMRWSPDPDQASSEPGDAYPVAYCAPGRREAAEETLAGRGEHVARIVEHAWLEGADGVYVVAEGPLDLTRLLPASYDFTMPDPQAAWLRDYWAWAWGLRINSPRLTVLTSVI
jgi:hypothetical protein